jgi:hypothetical protein
MTPIVRVVTVLLVFVIAACTSPQQRSAEQRAETERLENLGSFEECMMDAGEDSDKIAACNAP